MDNSTKKLLNGTLVYFIGNVLTQLISLALLRFVTGKISPEEYGIYNLVVTVTNLVIPFVSFQIPDALFKFAIKSKTVDESKAYFTTTFVVMVASVLLTFGGIAIVNHFVPLPHVLLIALHMVSSNLFTMYQKITRCLGKNTIYVVGNLVKTLAFLTLQIVFLYVFRMGVEALFLATIISTGLFLVFAEVKIRSFRLFDSKTLSSPVLKKMLLFSIPLIPNAVFWWLTSSINTVIVSARCGLDVNGLYSVANKFSVILTTVTSVFNLSWQESAITEYGEATFKSFFSQTTAMFMKGIFSTIAVLLPTMSIVFPAIIDETYYSAISYAPFLVMASGISAIGAFVAPIFLAQEKNSRCLISNVIGMLLNLAIVFALVDHIGIWAAISGTMLSNLAIAVSRLWMVRRDFEAGGWVWQIVLLIAFALIGVPIYLCLPMVWNVGYLAISVVVFAVFNRALIKNIFALVVEKIKPGKEG